MNMERRCMTENEYNNNWMIIFRQLNNLFNNEDVDDALLYNTIFFICTSMTSKETDLYWKIINFLLHRAREMHLLIENTKDTIVEYNANFATYKECIERLNKICVVLNECVKEKDIKSNGFLIWEKAVIQPMGDDFFNQVFLYKGTQNDENERINVVKSLQCIIPDIQAPLLYYQVKYEAIGLKNISKKYANISNIRDIYEFSDTVYSIALYESTNYDKYFLRDSVKNVENVLEAVIFSPREDGIILEYKDMLKAACKGMIHKPSDFRSKHFTEEFYSNELFLQLKPILEESPMDEAYELGLLKPIERSMIDDPHAMFYSVFDKLSTINSGWLLIKKAYVLFVYEMMMENQSILAGDISDVYDLFTRCNLFSVKEMGYIINNQKYQSKLKNQLQIRMFELEDILEKVICYFLKKIKPCYITRLVKHSEKLVKKAKDLKPYRKVDDKRIFEEFCKLLSLVEDKKELGNLYREELTRRILNKSSLIDKEKEIVKIITNSGVKNSFKGMLDDVDNETKHIRLLNNNCWDFTCEHSSIKMPDSLLKLISTELPNFKTLNNKNRCSYTYKNDKETKTIQFGHQFSKIRIKLNNRPLVLSMYQYVILDLLITPKNISEIYKSVDLNERKIDSILKNLIDNDLLHKNGDLYEIKISLPTNTLYNNFTDISCIDLNQIFNKEIDIDSYCTSILCQILKVAKRMPVEQYFKELTQKSKLVTVDKMQFKQFIDQLVEKGILEIEGDHCIYVL